MKQKKILVLLFCVVIGFVMSVIGYAQDEDEGAKKESPNDYYKNEEFKKIVDNIIKNYGGEEAIKEIKYCRVDTRVFYTHHDDSLLYETTLFSHITDTEPILMKYRREDYSKGPKDSKRQLISGITFNGKEVIQLSNVKTGRLSDVDVINTCFDTHYSFVDAFTIRLKDADYSVTYKGKEKNKEIGKDVYIIELKDNDPETLKERIITLYYNTSNYLLEAILFEKITTPDIPDKLKGLPPEAISKIKSSEIETLVLITGHKSVEIKSDKTKKPIKYISQIKFRSKIKDEPKFPKIEGVPATEIKVSLDKFNESIFDKKE